MNHIIVILDFLMQLLAVFVRQMQTPEGGIPGGKLFGSGPGVYLGGTWTAETGFLKLGSDGDNIFLYCLDGDSNIYFLAGFSNHNSWELPGLSVDQYGTTSSALPNVLLNANIVLEYKENYFYNGTRHEIIPMLKKDIRNPDKWVGDNKARYAPNDPSAAWRTIASNVCLLLAVILVWML